jgi:hypothetical protein
MTDHPVMTNAAARQLLASLGEDLAAAELWLSR